MATYPQTTAGLTPDQYAQQQGQPGAYQPAPPDNLMSQPAPPPSYQGFEDAVRGYQGQGGDISFEGLQAFLDEQGIDYQVPTRAGGTGFSEDKLTDPATGKMYDLIRDVGGPDQAWQFSGVNEGGSFNPMSFQSSNPYVGTPYLDQLLGKSGGPSQGAPTPMGAFSAPAPAGGAGPDIRADPANNPFASHPAGGVYIPSTGQWVPGDHPLAQTAGAIQAGAGAATGQSSASGSITSSPAPQGGIQSVYDKINSLLSSDGGYNQGLVDRRVGAARDTLERQRNAEMDTLNARLAEQGLLGSGATSESYSGLGERLGTVYGQQVSDIHAEENRAADTRMLTALVQGAGLSKSDADRIIAEFNAHTSRDVGMAGVNATNRATDSRERLGLGGLDLQQQLGLMGLGQSEMGMMMNHSLGLGNLGLGQNRLDLDAQNSSIDAILAALGRQQGSNTSEGYR